MLPPRAYVFIGLNAVRILSIIACILVFASNIVTLVDDVKAVNRFEAGGNNSTVTMTSGVNSTDTTASMAYISGSTVPNQTAGVFWAVLNRLLIIAQAVVLLFSELGWPEKFFDRFFPVLGKDFGVGALGVIQMLIGAAVLSHNVDTFTLVSAFFLFSIGCLNVLLGLIFREKAKSRRSFTSWKTHAKSVLPTPVQQGINIVTGTAVYRHSTEDEKKKLGHVFGSGGAGDSVSSKASSGLKRDFSGMGFGRQGEKAAELKGYMISRPVGSLPRYAPSPNAASVDGEQTMV